MLVDPHRDLARAPWGWCPPDGATRRLPGRGGRERPFGLNLLDTGLGWTRDKAVSNALLVFRREFDRFWGPRMEDAFRFALLIPVRGQRGPVPGDPHRGRARQHTVLEVPPVLAERRSGERCCAWCATR